MPRDTARARPDTILDPIPPRPDSIRVDSTRTKPALRDSAAARDTIKAPLARAEAPPLAADIGERYRWTRAEMFATGALNLSDLLDRIPGVTGFRGGWVASPMLAGMLGDVQRVRVFYDGIELDPIDPRTGGALDLQTVQLWTVEEVIVERAPSEVRVHLRSWRVEQTTAYTRTDISTGDYETNTYRAFFGRRFRHGEALQLSAQQFGTTDPQGGDGDALSLMGRVGWARGLWSLDGFFNRTHGVRSAKGRAIGLRPLQGLDATRTDAYIRGAYGDPERGLWAQALAASTRFAEATPVTTADRASATGLPADSADTTRSRAQYVASAGWTAGRMRASVTHRMRVFEGWRLGSPSARASFDGGVFAIEGFAEHDALREHDRGDVTARATPLPFVAVSGGASLSRPKGDGDRSLTLRGEVAVRLRELWLSGGAVRTDSMTLPALVLFDATFQAAPVSENTAYFAAVRGRLYRAIWLDVTAMRWDSASFYRPQTQVRSELRLATRWLSRFPSGNFSIVAAGMHEYRSEVSFPTAGEVLVVPQSFPFSTLLEVRIVNAVLFWQFRNVAGFAYEQVPGLRMPRQTNIYGVRWEFWN